MKSINIDNINEESFVEYQILACEIDIKNKKIHILVNGGVLNDGTYLNKVNIFIEDWLDLGVNQIEKDKQKELDANEVTFISNIVKLEYEKNKFVLYDIGDHSWIVWTFIKAKIIISGE